jgi:esterase/lipase
MTLTIDKDKMTENLQKHFDETHVEYYKKVVKERTRIYLTGFGIGLVLSLILLFIMKYKMKKISNLVIICTCIAVSYTTMYFYYTLSPKMDLMVVQLDKKEARIAWQNYYNNMKNKYHISMLLGVVFSFLINNGLCK